MKILVSILCLLAVNSLQAETSPKASAHFPETVIVEGDQAERFYHRLQQVDHAHQTDCSATKRVLSSSTLTCERSNVNDQPSYRCFLSVDVWNDEVRSIELCPSFSIIGVMN